MIEQTLQNLSPLEKLIFTKPGRELKAMLGNYKKQPSNIMSFTLDTENNAERLFKTLNTCKSWLPVYDNNSHTLYSQYEIEVCNERVYINIKTGEYEDNFKFITDGSLQKSKYLLVPQGGDKHNSVALCKYQPNTEYSHFNLSRGLKEFVYSLATTSPMLPVLCHDSLTMHIKDNCHALRLSMLVTDNLDLHLSQSRNKIYNSMKENLINSYRSSME